MDAEKALTYEAEIYEEMKRYDLQLEVLEKLIDISTGITQFMYTISAAICATKAKKYMKACDYFTELGPDYFVFAYIAELCYFFDNNNTNNDIWLSYYNKIDQIDHEARKELLIGLLASVDIHSDVAKFVDVITRYNEAEDMEDWLVDMLLLVKKYITNELRVGETCDTSVGETCDTNSTETNNIELFANMIAERLFKLMKEDNIFFL